MFVVAHVIREGILVYNQFPPQRQIMSGQSTYITLIVDSLQTDNICISPLIELWKRFVIDICEVMDDIKQYQIAGIRQIK